MSLILMVVKGILLLHGIQDCACAEPKHGYMTHFYFSRQPAHVNDSLVLELTNRFLPDEPDQHYLACDVNVVTSQDRKLMVHFLSLEISDENTIDRLHIYDYHDGRPVRLSPAQGLYGLYDIYFRGLAGGVRDYRSTGNRLKLDYQGKPTLVYDGFKILITSFRDTAGDCGRSYFRCRKKGICVPVSTLCDGYQNCGNDDTSDEEHCSRALANTWKPVDGQVAAVVAASVSITTLILVTGVIILAVRRVNKRYIINTTNVTVEFRKKRTKKKSAKGGKQRNTENLTRLYAPPSYEVVVGMDEAPPPYHSVADEYTSSEEEDGMLVEQIDEISAGPGTCVIMPEDEHLVTENLRQACAKPPDNHIKVTSALVVCDVEGNNSCQTKLVEGASNLDSDFQNLTNLKKCSSINQNDVKPGSKRLALVRESSHLDEIEIISSNSDDSRSTNDENENRTRTKGKGATQTVASLKGTNNGFVKGVTYKRSPSSRDADTIEFADSD
ncbi:uncharacterized protein LOC128217791 [Mya arenaria]|uniref:uncharacterized protein LOC128217791 n=1 Tax=Mya arenaria TaxID=6604 RepID=UPI0022E21D37|nr:uncharacterized protein LOC128217791 [Mya arenaria]